MKVITLQRNSSARSFQQNPFFHIAFDEVDIDGSDSKKRKLRGGRREKIIADYALLCGSGRDAYEQYDAALLAYVQCHIHQHIHIHLYTYTLVHIHILFSFVFCLSLTIHTTYNGCGIVVCVYMIGVMYSYSYLHFFTYSYSYASPHYEAINLRVIRQSLTMTGFGMVLL